MYSLVVVPLVKKREREREREIESSRERKEAWGSLI
jgi:hypothetical protein